MWTFYMLIIIGLNGAVEILDIPYDRETCTYMEEQINNIEYNPPAAYCIAISKGPK